MEKINSNNPMIAALAVLVASLPNQVMAQTDARRMAIEEIIVTAQKRDENIQDVPISISALTEASLALSGITKTDELSMVVPGLQMNRVLGSSTPYLRGVGTENATAGDESNIATYVDGVFMSNMFAAVQNFGNVERVEVLKGPQGTLFGRNATGGLIHIISKDPQQEFSGVAKASYGAYDTVNTSLYLSGGITDNIAADIGVFYANQGEGYGKNVFDGKEANRADMHSRGVRSTWLIDFSERTQGRLSLDYYQRRESTANARHLDPGAVGLDGVTTYTGDFYDVNFNVDSFTDSEAWGGAFKLTHQFDAMNLVSISAYRTSSSHYPLDHDATPVNVIAADLRVRSEFFSQELQLLSSADGPLQWVVGLYYMNDSSEYDPYGLGGIAISGSTGAQQFRGYPVQDSESYAAFAQLTYSLSERTSITGGLRFTRDERDLEVTRLLDFGAMNVFLPPIEKDETWTEPSWRISLDHQVADSFMVYASYSRGFKSGVFNTSAILGVDGTGPVDPEILDAYEVGFKSMLLDDRLRLNGSIFYYDFTDMQLGLRTATAQLLVNAAESEILGLDLELTALVTEGFEIHFGLSVLDSEFKEYPSAPVSTPNPLGGNTIGSADVSGNKLPRAPDYSFNIGGNYSIPIAAGTVLASVNYYYNDGFYWTPQNRMEQDSYGVLNAELSWTSLSERLRISLYGKNLTDDEYSLFGSSGEPGDVRSSAEPRRSGVAVEYRF